MDHSELVTELPRIEKLTAAERLRIARDRRAMQLRLFEQREKEYNAKRAKLAGSDKKKKTSTTSNPTSRKKDRNIRFVSSVMLLEAAARNDVEEVRRLLMNGVSPDSTNEDGLTALHQCCIDDSEEMMKILLDFGANVNAEDSEKWTPLHAAATCGHLHLVKYLISKGANLLAVNADGNMPYDICEDELTLDYIESEMAKRGITQELIDQTRAATEHNMLMDLKALASKGRSLEYRDHVGATPLHVAAANGYLSVVEFLLDQHVATDVRDNDGWHPIHAAACWGHADILELLVQNGADLNAETKNHEKPYDICEDPELKNRIAAILAEQENKKLAEAAHRGTRRSGSSTAANTRTQSIRRTSIREKTMTAKKDARNEALIRLQKEHENYAESSAEGKDVASRAASHHGSDEVDGEEENVAFAFAGLRKDTRGEIKLSPSEREQLQKQEANNNKNSSKRAAPPPPVADMKGKSNQRPTNGVSNTSDLGRTRVLVPPQVLTSASHGSSESKIDIHVSVTINTSAVNNTGSVPSLSGVPCTLADLKRQRAHSRFLVAGTSGPVSSPPAAFHNVLLLSHTETNSAVVASNHSKTNPGDSTRNENVDYLVLKGDTQDVVGSSKEKKICCVIS